MDHHRQRKVVGLDVEHKSFIDKANPYFYCASVVLIFSTLLTLSWPLVLLWSCAIGVLGAYLFFRNRILIPNLLLHLKPVINVEDDHSSPDQSSCPVCGNSQCIRHPKLEINPQDVAMPWSELTIPQTIDNTLTEFLNVIMDRFISSWHSDLTKSRHFNSEVCQLIRRAVCLFLQRVNKIDIPKVVTGPLLQVLAKHMHLYISIRKKLPHNSSQKLFEDVAMETLGTRLHVALRGKTAEFRYFKNLTRSVLPLLVSTETIKSKVLVVFLEELFSAKIMIPAMDFVSSPDFLNRILILLFDKETRLCRVPYPPSCPVFLLEKFANQEEKDLLQPDLSKILSDQKLLYSFMQFLKRHHSLHLLQFYSTCNDVIGGIEGTRMGPLLAQNSHVYLDQILQLHELFTYNSVDPSISLDPTLINKIKEVIIRDESDLSKITYLIQYNYLHDIREQVRKVIEISYCQSFYHSQEYHDGMYPLLTVQTQRSLLSTDQHSIRVHFEKWRSRRKRRMTSRPSTELDTQSSTPPLGVTRQRSSSNPTQVSPSPPPSPSLSSLQSSNNSSILEESVSFSRCSVQVVDHEIISTAAIKKPYTLYVIVTRQENEGKTIVFKVKRRYKEFVVLDSRIRQFYRNIPSSLYLPPKRAFHNMDKNFIELRVKELQGYLQRLVEEPEIRNSQLMQSFLSDTADISLFMPDTVGEKAGKIIKSVPRALKKEPKGQHLDTLLVSMDEGVVIAPREPCSEKRLLTDKYIAENETIIEDYNKSLADDLSTDKKTWLSLAPAELGNHVTLNGIMDLLVYLAINVYKVSKTKLTVLLATKMLAQSSVEAFFHDLISNRIELICQEHEICQLIELLKYHLFFDEDPPRTQKDKNERRDLALHTVLTRPPELLVQLIGTDNFISNTTMLVDGLQNQFLAKHMLFSMLDVVVCELFPELQGTL